MELLNFELGSLRSSVTAKEYQKDVFRAISTSQPDAYRAIFVLLPELIDRLERELEMPFYQIQKPLEAIRERIVFPAVDVTQDSLAAAAFPNQEVLNMHTWAEGCGEDLRRALDLILLWFQVLLPKCPSSGADRNEDILLELTTECQKAYDRTNAFYEDVTEYHEGRAELIKDCRKHPGRDFMIALVYFDAQEIKNSRAYVLETMENAMTLYTGIVTNYEAILKNLKKDKLGVIY